jgi:hypothetical protein
MIINGYDIALGVRMSITKIKQISFKAVTWLMIINGNDIVTPPI